MRLMLVLIRKPNNTKNKKSFTQDGPDICPLLKTALTETLITIATAIDIIKATVKRNKEISRHKN